MELAGTLAVVTGASSGIGEATAKALAKAGARVVVIARTRDALERVAKEIQDAGGKAEVVAADLSKPAECRRATREVLENFGVPDVLVNNAGVGRWLPVEETSFEEVQQMMALPYFAAFWVTSCLLPEMLKRRTGHIVNLISPAGWAAIPGAAGYSAARAAMRSFDQSLGVDLRGTGLGVTLCCPGKVSSSYFANNPGAEERIPRIAALARTVTPEEVGAAIVRAIRLNRRTLVMPCMMRVFWWLFRSVPWLVEALAWGSGWKRSALPPPAEKSEQPEQR